MATQEQAQVQDLCAKCSIGRKLSADHLLSEARELIDYLKHTMTIEEIMDEV